MKQNNFVQIFKPKIKTKTQLFTTFLIKSCIFPLHLDKINNTLSFKFWSKSTLIHLLVYPILLLGVPQVLVLTNEKLTLQVFLNFFNENSFVENVSFIMNLPFAFGYFLMVPLCGKIICIDAKIFYRYFFFFAIRIHFHYI